MAAARTCVDVIGDTATAEINVSSAATRTQKWMEDFGSLVYDVRIIVYRIHILAYAIHKS